MTGGVEAVGATGRPGGDGEGWKIEPEADRVGACCCDKINNQHKHNNTKSTG